MPATAAIARAASVVRASSANAPAVARVPFVDSPRDDRFDVTTWGEVGRTRLARSAGAGIAIQDFHAPAGFGPPRHLHRNDDEIFLVHQGVMALWSPGACTVARAGDLVFLPRNVPHTWRAAGDEPVRAMIITTPGEFETFFRDLAARRVTLAERDELFAIASAAGVEVLGPPLGDDEVATILAGGQVDEPLDGEKP